MMFSLPSSQKFRGYQKQPFTTRSNYSSRAGLLREINIHEHEMRYDLILRDHGHFKCLRCGEISNFDIDIQNYPISGLGQYQIKERDVLFKGICPKCQAEKVE